MSKTSAAILELSTSLDDKGLKQFDKKLNKLGVQVRKTGKEGQVAFEKIEKSSKKTGTSLAGMATQIVGVAMAFTQIYQETKAVINEQRKMKQVLQSTGHAAGLSYKELKKMAGALQEVTTFKKADIMRAQNTLLTFTGVGKDAFQDVLNIGMDMAAFFGGDLQSHIIRVGKAFQNPAEQAAALRDVGVNLNKQQVELIKNFEKAGNKAAAQAVILKELKTEFGGAAEAMAQSGIGNIEQATARFKDVMVSVGKVLLPPIAEVANVLSVIFGWFTKLPGPIKAVTVALVGMGVAFMAATPVGWISGAILAIGGLISVFKKTERTLGDIKTANNEVEHSAAKAAKAFKKQDSMNEHLKRLKNLKEGTSSYKREVEKMLRLSPELRKAGITTANSYGKIEAAVKNMNSQLIQARRLQAYQANDKARLTMMSNQAWFTDDRESKYRALSSRSRSTLNPEDTRFITTYEGRLQENERALKLYLRTAILAGMGRATALNNLADLITASGANQLYGVSMGSGNSTSNTAQPFVLQPPPSSSGNLDTQTSTANAVRGSSSHNRFTPQQERFLLAMMNVQAQIITTNTTRVNPYTYGSDSGSGATGLDWDWQKEIKKLKSEFVQLKAGTMWQQAAKSLYGDQFKKQVDKVRSQFKTLQEEKKAMINSEFDQRDKAAKAAFDKDRTKQAEYNQFKTKSAENRKLKLQQVDDEYRLYTEKAETDLLIKRYQFEYDTSSGTTKQILGIKIAALQREQQIREKYAHDEDAMNKALAQARMDYEKELSDFRKAELDKLMQDITTGIDTASRVVDTLADESKAVEERLYDSAQMIASQFGPTGQLIAGGMGLAKSIFGAFKKESKSWAELFEERLESILATYEEAIEKVDITKSVKGVWDIGALQDAVTAANKAVTDLKDNAGLVGEYTQEELLGIQDSLDERWRHLLDFDPRVVARKLTGGMSPHNIVEMMGMDVDKESIQQAFGHLMPDNIQELFLDKFGDGTWRELMSNADTFLSRLDGNVASQEMIDAMTDLRNARIELVTAQNNEQLAILEHRKNLGEFEDDETAYYEQKMDYIDQNIERLKEELEIYGDNAELQQMLWEWEEERYATQQAINNAKNEEYQINEKYLKGAKGKQLQELLDMKERLKMQIETGEVRYDQRTASVLQLLNRKIAENLQGQGAGRDQWWQYQEDAAQISKDMYGEKYFQAMSGTGQAVYLSPPDLSHLMPASSVNMMQPQINVSPTPVHNNIQTPVQITTNVQMPPDVVNWVLDVYKQNTGQDLGGM